MKYIKTDKELCIGCGRCINDCVAEKIKLVNGKAEFMFERCIQCGHCFAVCPVNAITMTNFEYAEHIPTVNMNEFDSDKLLLAMKSRRSVRRFKDEDVSDELIEKIIEAGRYCPTATNAQDVSFTVIRNKLPEIEKEAVKIFRSAQKTEMPFSKYIKHASIDDSFFFKGAKVVIAVNAKDATNAALASSYMELMAESLGLGVFYSGFLIGVTKFCPDIASMLETRQDHSPVTALVIGWPDVEYKRIPPRNKAEINYI